MENPYPIYFNKRLLRTVYIVNPESFNKEEFGKIFNFNINNYGGRFNPIIFSVGNDLTTDCWSFLKEFDPDVITFLTKPAKTFLSKITDRVSPYVVDVIGYQGYVHPNDDLPRINYPSNELIKKAYHFPFPDEVPFVLFDIEKLNSDNIKKFIHFNFGTYEKYLIEQIVRKVQHTKIYSLDTSTSLSESLKELGNVHKNFVFPIQLASVPNSLVDVEYNPDNENFTVIVGDSIYDLVHFWNRSLMVPNWIRPGICHMWLPLEVAEDPTLKDGLQQLFQQRASRTGNGSNGKFINFISFSVKEDKLKLIAESLGEKTWCGKKVTVLKEKQIFPNYGKQSGYFSIKQGMDFYQAYTEEENIVVDDMDLPEGVTGGHWMLDTYIQYRPQKFQHTNLRHWWILPNRNELARLFFSNKISRIQSNGIPSVLMKNKSTFNPDELKLNINIPSDKSIIRSLIHGINRPVYTSDLRSVFNKKEYNFQTSVSDKGRYLQGIVGLFDGLAGALHSCRDPYWKRMFETLSLSNPASDKTKKDAILGKLKNTLLKSLPTNKHEREEELEWLSNYILDTSKQHGKSGTEENFDFLYREKIKLISEYLKAQNKSTKISKVMLKQHRDNLFQDVTTLVNNNILVTGLKPHCTSCGHSNWLNVEEIKQKVKCRGCGYIFDLKIEMNWLYKLNSLLESGVRQHGLLPVILTLGEMYDDARSSFIYSPSLDLYQRVRNKWKHLGDLDIACVKDGEFIIGEIKKSSGLFKKSHFDEAFNIAKKLKPNTIMFSSFDGRPTKRIVEEIKKLKDRLEPYGINVVWYDAVKIFYQY